MSDTTINPTGVERGKIEANNELLDNRLITPLNGVVLIVGEQQQVCKNVFVTKFHTKVMRKKRHLHTIVE